MLVFPALNASPLSPSLPLGGLILLLNVNNSPPPCTQNGKTADVPKVPASSPTPTPRRRAQMITSYAWEDYGEEVRLTFRQSGWDWSKVYEEEVGAEWGPRRFRLSIDSRCGCDWVLRIAFDRNNSHNMAFLKGLGSLCRGGECGGLWVCCSCSCCGCRISLGVCFISRVGLAPSQSGSPIYDPFIMVPFFC